MYNTVKGDLVFFATCVCAGILAAFLYDIIRISRRVVKINDSVVCGQDIFFLVFCSIVFFLCAYIKNSGEVRWQGILGGVLGTGGYFFVVKNRFVNFGTTVTKWIIKVLLTVLKTLLFPLKIVLRALKKPIEVVAWYTGSGLKRAKRVAKCQKARIKMRVLAARALIKKK